MLPSELLANPAAWIQGDLAQDKHGRVVSQDDCLATRFCILGAVSRCAGTNRAQWAEDAAKLRKTLEARGWTAGAVFFNDEPGRTHAEVLALLKRAGL